MSTRVEGESVKIDRLVLGRPRKEVLIKRALEMLEEGLLQREIAAHYGISTEALEQMLCRHRKSK